ncbi:telomerase component p95-like [Chironomus tepperi]|uniref:telomerase component p95-like n=1 Tax=Chironomus tepperi TaxID=113505 RepID=UPI00391EEDC0
MISEIYSEIERILCCKKASIPKDEHEIPLRHANRLWSSFRNDEMVHHLDHKDKFANNPNLPAEIIIKIISNLDDFEDLKNCMLLSKTIRNSIFKTPEIMRKIIVNLSCSESSKFLDFRGHSIRCLRIQSFQDGTLQTIFSKVPNLEELTFKNGQLNDRFSRQNSILIHDFDKNNNPKDILDESSRAELPNLKILELRSSNFEMFTKCTQNVTKLEKFTIYMTELNHSDSIAEFVAHQSSLTDLNLTNISQLHVFDFPYQLICSKAAFKLKILKIIRIKCDVKFLESQLENLEELELTEVDSINTLEIILKKSRKLRKLSLGSVACSWLLLPDFMDLKLQTLKFYEDRNSKGVELDKIYAKFPNLLSLKCLQLTPVDGIFDVLESLEVFVLDCQKLLNLQLNSLKNLTIVKISKFSDPKLFEKFTKNIKNIENLTIKHIEDHHNIPSILKCLKEFKNLKTFKLKQASYYDDYEITIDTKERTVKTLRSSVEKNQEILKVLNENFEDFEFFEFKSFIGKIKKFDIVVQLDKH